MEDFITILYKTKLKDETLNIENKEVTQWQKRSDKVSEEMFDFISEHLEEKYHEIFTQMMLEYEENIAKKAELEKELYYKAGVKYGVKIAETLKN